MMQRRATTMKDDEMLLWVLFQGDARKRTHRRITFCTIVAVSCLILCGLVVCSMAM